MEVETNIHQKLQIWLHGNHNISIEANVCTDLVGNGNIKNTSNTIYIDKTGPTATRCEIKNITPTGYEVFVYGVTDDASGVNRIQFPTWTSNNGQDDLAGDWENNNAVKGVLQEDGTTWKFRVNTSEHNFESGLYYTDIYGYDNFGNRSFISSQSVNVPNVTISFDARGGTTPSVSTITKGYGNAIGTLPTTSMVGYTFLGWYTAPSGGTKIEASSTMPANNTTYYAQWSINNYTIDLNMTVDNNIYNSGYNNRIKVGLRIAGQDMGYVTDYCAAHPYGTYWEIYGLNIDGININYSQSGTMGAQTTDARIYFYTVNFGVNNSAYGNVNIGQYIALQGSSFYANGQTLALSDGRSVYASIINASGYSTTFTGWSPSSGSINSTTNIIANFNRVDITAPNITIATQLTNPTEVVNWYMSNNYTNTVLGTSGVLKYGAFKGQPFSIIITTYDFSTISSIEYKISPDNVDSTNFNYLGNVRASGTAYNKPSGTQTTSFSGVSLPYSGMHYIYVKAVDSYGNTSYGKIGLYVYTDKEKFVVLCYNNVLGRAPEYNGLSSHINVINNILNGATPPTYNYTGTSDRKIKAIINTLAECYYSDEYKREWWNSKSRQDCVRTFYWGALRRTPGDSEISGWVNKDMDNIFTGIATSTEAIQKFAQYSLNDY